MHNGPSSWGSLLPWIFPVAVVLAASLLGRRDPGEPERAADGVVLKPDPRLLYMGVGAIIATLSFGVAALLLMKGARGIHDFALSIVLALMCVAPVVLYYRTRFLIAETGVAMGAASARKPLFRWHEVVQLAYEQGSPRLRISLQGGRAVAIPTGLIGFRVLAERLLSQAAGAQMDEGTRSFLSEAVATGHAPART